MAFVTDTNIVAPTQNVFAKIAKALGRFIIDMAEANSRSQTIAILNSKTDRQLADMGIAREDIVRHVFRDKMYL